jgi:hypothetical protein
MMPRWYLRFDGGTAYVHDLVGLAPSNHGTTVDGISTLFDAVTTLGLPAPLTLAQCPGRRCRTSRCRTSAATITPTTWPCPTTAPPCRTWCRRLTTPRRYRSTAGSAFPCSVADGRPAGHGLAVAARYFTTDHYH